MQILQNHHDLGRIGQTIEQRKHGLEEPRLRGLVVGARGRRAGQPGEETGEGFVPAGEVCGAGWFFISSRRNALLATLWCA